MKDLQRLMRWHPGGRRGRFAPLAAGAASAGLMVGAFGAGWLLGYVLELARRHTAANEPSSEPAGA